MAKTISGKIINRICIIDDDATFRSVLEDTVNEAEFEPVPQNDKIDNLEEYLGNVQPNDAVVSDHQLKKKNYFPVNGAEVVFNCYAKGIPSVLVTRYEPHIGEIRKYRRNIPVILNPDDFEPDTLYKSLEICIDELNGLIRPSRKIWRSLVRVDGIDENHIFVIIPAWDSNEVISLNREDLPQEIREILQPDIRLHAKINIGTESPNDLFFVGWETK